MLKKSKTKGESLIEVVISIGVLAIGAIAATSLMISSVRSSALNKNYLVAVNLAREGVEAVRSIRDTNWLKFSYDTEACWDVLDDSLITQGDCDSAPNNKLAAIGSGAKYYKAIMDQSSYKWMLDPVTNISAFNPATNKTAREEYLLEPDSSSKIYSHSGSEYASTGTSFYRGIIILKESEKVTNDGTIRNTAVRVISLVQWFEGEKMREVSAETILSNYQT